MDIEQFGAWLTAEMEKRDLSCYKLAKMAGLSTVTVIYYTRNQRTPSFGTLKLLLDALGKHVEIVDN